MVSENPGANRQFITTEAVSHYRGAASDLGHGFHCPSGSAVHNCDGAL